MLFTGAVSADRQQLALVVPLVNRMRGIQTFIALKADQVCVQYLCQRLGDLGLADASGAFQQQRTPQNLRQMQRHGCAVICQIAGFGQSGL